MKAEMACEARRNLATEAQRHGEYPNDSLCLGVSLWPILGTSQPVERLLPRAAVSRGGLDVQRLGMLIRIFWMEGD